MSRSLVTMRDATLADVEHLAELWAPFLRRGTADEPLNDVATAIERLSDGPGERLVVAEYDGEFAGGVFLRAAAYSPVNSDLVLQVHNLAVVPAHRRHGVGKALVECGRHVGRGARHRLRRHGRVVGLARGQPLHGAPGTRSAGCPARRADLRGPREAVVAPRGGASGHAGAGRAPELRSSRTV